MKIIKNIIAFLATSLYFYFVGFVGFMILFETLLTWTIEWSLLIKVIFWTSIGFMIFMFAQAIAGSILGFVLNLLKASKSASIIGIFCLLFFLGHNVVVWFGSNYIQYSWEIYPPKVFWKLCFSFMTFSIIPFLGLAISKMDDL